MPNIDIRTDIVQNSDEWFRLRLGRITGSNFAKLLIRGETRDKYIYTLASEILTNTLSDQGAVNGIHIERGRAYEDIARRRYSASTFSSVQQVGLVLRDNIACSPDGFVDDDGIIEIKVPDSHNYLANIIAIKREGIKAIKKDYYWQMQFNMYVCGREWCDYVLYNQAHSCNNKEIFVQRVHKNEQDQKVIQDKIEEATKEMQAITVQYNLIHL